MVDAHSAPHTKKQPRWAVRLVRATMLLFVLAAVLLLAMVGFVTQPGVTAIHSAPPPVDPAQLEAHVKKLSVDFYPRSFERRGNTAQTVQYVTEQFVAAGAEVSIQTFAVQEEKHHNVIARFGPSTGAVMVVGAHYDSHGDTQSGVPSRNTHTPGADDNASGVAGILELARLLGQHPPKEPIELVAYATEEPPHFRTEHMGSARHAQNLVMTGRAVKLMLSVEMIGYFSDTPGSQHYPVPGMASFYSDRGDFIALVGKLSDFNLMRRAKALMRGATDLPVYSMNAPVLLPGVDFSDHLSYWHEGIPALMVTDTAFLRNKNYHRAEDTFEKLDYVRMAKAVQGIYALMQRF